MGGSEEELLQGGFQLWKSGSYGPGVSEPLRKQWQGKLSSCRFDNREFQKLHDKLVDAVKLWLNDVLIRMAPATINNYVTDLFRWLKGNGIFLNQHQVEQIHSIRRGIVANKAALIPEDEEWKPKTEEV